MNYNIVVVVSLLISSIISFLFSYYLMNLFLESDKLLFKIGQLILVIIFVSTFYSPIKYILLKYMNIEEYNKDENE